MSLKPFPQPHITKIRGIESGAIKIGHLTLYRCLNDQLEAIRGRYGWDLSGFQAARHTTKVFIFLKKTITLKYNQKYILFTISNCQGRLYIKGCTDKARPSVRVDGKPRI